MKIKNIIFSVLKSTCVIYTVVSLIVITISDLAMTKETTNPSISRSLWIFFALSVLLAIANLILKLKKMSSLGRLALHFIACTFLYYLTVVIIGGFGNNGRQLIVAMMLYLLVYIIFAVIHIMTSSAKRKKKSKTDKYESMFK